MFKIKNIFHPSEMKTLIVGWAYTIFAGIVAIFGSPQIWMLLSLLLFSLLMAQLTRIEIAILSQSDALKRKDGGQ